jgi:hypothetical protein
VGNSLKILEIDVVCTVCGRPIKQCMAYAHDNMVIHHWYVCRECLEEAVSKMYKD